MNKTTSQLASLQKPTDFGFGNSPPDPSVIVDIIFLATLTICGTAGNLLIICSVIHAKTVLRNGNVFIINLACADLTVSLWFCLGYCCVQNNVYQLHLS